MKRQLETRAANSEPALVWNAFIDLIAVEGYEDLSPVQRKAHLVFWYESEVQNGGHGQFFENQGLLRLEETIGALEDLGLSCYARVLELAAVPLLAAPPGVAWENVLRSGCTEDLDRQFHACEPSIVAGLQRHLEAYREEYVDFV